MTILKLRTYVKYTLIRKWRKQPHKIQMSIKNFEYVLSFGNIKLIQATHGNFTLIRVFHTNESKTIFDSLHAYHHWYENKISNYNLKRMLKY